MNVVAIGSVKVATTVERGHDLDFHVDRLMDRLIYISHNAPEPIRAQAMLYKDSMAQLIRDAFIRVQKSHTSTLVGELRRAGLDDAAHYVSKL